MQLALNPKLGLYNFKYGATENRFLNLWLEDGDEYSTSSQTTLTTI